MGFEDKLKVISNLLCQRNVYEIELEKNEGLGRRRGR
jgi:hypothetical protein